MFKFADLERIPTAILALGGRRLTAFGLLLAVSLFLVLSGTYFLSIAEFETAYVGLAPPDATRIGRALNEAGIAFDVSSDGTRLMTRRGDFARARAYLAERGLPSSPGSGYELFDKVGPLGLTTFMQDVTRTRALEVEISRTLQLLKGVRAARVHLALGDSGPFQRQRQAPSASVVVRTDNPTDRAQAEAIQHIVSAAVQGLLVTNVRVINADGRLMSTIGDEGSASSDRLLALEKAVAQEIQNNINRTLAPQLGPENFEASVAVRLNIDKRQINETTFSPEGRVERSTRLIKEISNSQNASSRNVTVEQNIPTEPAATQSGDQGRKSNQKRDELTNYEVGNRQTATITDGYRLDRISIAVILNSKRLAETAGSTGNGERIEQKISNIERLVASAAGVDVKRGDQVTVAAVDFATNNTIPEGNNPDGVTASTIITQHFALLLKLISVIAITVLLIVFGLRPATAALLAAAQPAATSGVVGALQSAKPNAARAIASSSLPRLADGNVNPPANLLNDEAPTELIRRLVSKDSPRAALVLRRWLKEADAS